MIADKGSVLSSLCLLCLSVWRAGASTEGCPDIVLQSAHFAKVHDGVCYLFVDQELYWTDARATCWNMGGEMLSIGDERTMQFIRSVLNSRQLRWFRKGVWLGARYAGGRWRWTTGVMLDYNNWAPGEPSMLLGLFSVEDCALMRRDDNWRWHDYLCGSLKFHYNFICEFPFNSESHYEAHTGSQARDNGNMTVLTIILTSGGIVLLILLMVFFVVRHRYNYKKLVCQPDVHFDNRSYDLAVNQPVANSHRSRSIPPPPARLSNSRPSSSLGPDSVEMEAAALKLNGTTVGLLKESAQPGESASTSLSCSDEDLGACGGVPSPKRESQTADYVLPSSGGARWSQTPETMLHRGDSLKQGTGHSHSDYVHMNGNLSAAAAQTGAAVTPPDSVAEGEERGSKRGNWDQPRAADSEESKPSTELGYDSHAVTSKSSENLYEDFS